MTKKTNVKTKNAARKRTKGSVAIALVAVVALISAAGFLYGRLPPRPREDMLSRQPPIYEGVMEIWLSETFQPGKGSYLRWLLNSAAIYERQNPGSFIDVKVVAPQVAKELIARGEELPDAILCSGGVISGTEISVAKLLLAQEDDWGVLPVLESAVSQGGKLYGIPISAGAYTILYNKDRLAQAGINDRITAENIGELHQGATSRPRRSASYAISCPRTEYISYSSALLYMIDLSTVDMGILPPNIFTVEAKFAWADFVLEKRSAAYVATQKEVFRIRELEAGNNAFAWQVHQEPCLYTDQLLSLHMFKTAESDEKQSALNLFAEILLSEQRQKALADIGAFSVLDEFEYIYPAGSSMHTMEAGIKSADIIVPNMFLWDESVQRLIRAEEGGGDASGRLESIRDLLENINLLE
ncbi:MAG: hypothetical protein ACOX8S_06535 [Christensenellales bacterium]